MLYNPDDTIAAISTPPGTGGIGIIRLSGPRAVEIADKIFSSSGSKPLSGTNSHTITHGWITDSGTPIDEVMAALMLGPNSYTGEDTVEISAHGGPVILGRILKLALGCGARLAGPGEFTYRAFLNGKLDLAKAESVADLISSKTGLALDAAFSHLNGSFSAKIKSLKEELTGLLAAFEASLDHAEEEIEFVSKENALKILAGLDSFISRIILASKKARFLKEGIRTAIIGRPNAGKSSLLNALLQRERAIVTDIPGTTRDVIEEAVDIEGFPVILMDTAGIREHAQDPVEKIGRDRAIEALKSADVALWVVDASAKDLPAERHIAEILGLNAKDKLIIPILGKSDLPTVTTAKEISKLLPVNCGPVISLSAKTGSGLAELEKALVSAFKISGGADAETFSANTRHIDALERALKALREAAGAINEGNSEEITALHLREALDFLGEITGETATEEILDRIFKSFCVGK